jgi:hypothetical protein
MSIQKMLVHKQDIQRRQRVEEEEHTMRMNSPYDTFYTSMLKMHVRKQDIQRRQRVEEEEQLSRRMAMASMHPQQQQQQQQHAYPAPPATYPTQVILVSI